MTEQKRRITLRWKEDEDDVFDALSEEAQRRKMTRPEVIRYLARAYHLARLGDTAMLEELVSRPMPIPRPGPPQEADHYPTTHITQATTTAPEEQP